MKRSATILISVVVLALSLIGCSSSKKSSSSSSSSGSAAASPTAPVIKNFTFSPNPIMVKVGSKVTWTNKDGTDHTVQADDSSFSSSHLAGGQSFSFTFTKAGTYSYHCAIHTYMKGSVVVS